MYDCALQAVIQAVVDRRTVSVVPCRVVSYRSSQIHTILSRTHPSYQKPSQYQKPHSQLPIHTCKMPHPQPHPSPSPTTNVTKQTTHRIQPSASYMYIHTSARLPLNASTCNAPQPPLPSGLQSVGYLSTDRFFLPRATAHPTLHPAPAIPLPATTPPIRQPPPHPAVITTRLAPAEASACIVFSLFPRV